MSKKRDKLQIIYDILRVIQDRNGKVKPTQILYKSNLSHQMMDEYLRELVKKEFVLETHQGKSRTYSLTQKGFDYVHKYRSVMEFMNSFGLSDDES